jgi:endonuclease G, mitochondrial
MSAAQTAVFPARRRALCGVGLALAFALSAGCRLDYLLEEHNEQPALTATSTGKETPRPTATATSPKEKAPSVHLELGTPVDKGPADDQLMIKPQYTLSYNKERNGASWVGWRLVADDFGPAPRHKGKFLVDDSLPEGLYRVTHDDYTGSGFDRGHMVRSEERTRSPEENKTTFLMTNILPQTHDLNAGPWLRLEEYAQELAQKQKRTLFVVAGGIYNKNKRPDTIGKGVAVPESFFKVIVVLDRGQGAAEVGEGTRVIGVIMPNKEGIQSDGWGKYRRPVDEIEKRCGYDLLPAVAEPVQRVIESRVDDGPTGQ